MSPRIITTRDGFHQPHTTSLQRERMEGAFEDSTPTWHGLAVGLLFVFAILGGIGVWS